MCWNLVEVGRQHDGEGEGVLCLCDALELLSILSPDDNEHKLLLARVYMHLSINMPQVGSSYCICKTSECLFIVYLQSFFTD